MRKLLIVAFLLFTLPAYAAIEDDFSNSTMAGYIVQGEAHSIIENVTVFHPENQQVLGIPLTLGRYKMVLLDDDQVVDDVLFIGHIGNYDPEKNNTWYLYLRQIDEPFNAGSTGILYDAARHWLGDDAPPIYIGAGVMEGGEMMYSLIGEYEFQPGYFVYADVYMTMEKGGLNPDAREGKVGFRKNMDPEGKVYIDAFYYNISGSSYVGAGVGYTF